jgi:hypothetical protein
MADATILEVMKLSERLSGAPSPIGFDEMSRPMFQVSDMVAHDRTSPLSRSTSSLRWPRHERQSLIVDLKPATCRARAMGSVSHRGAAATTFVLRDPLALV